jgi:hypothetical protein
MRIFVTCIVHEDRSGDSSDQIKDEIGGAGSMHRRYPHILVEKPEGKGPFGKPSLRSQYNIKINLRQIMC